jgi:hypothetical protein
MPALFQTTLAMRTFTAVIERDSAAQDRSGDRDPDHTRLHRSIAGDMRLTVEKFLARR